MPLSKLFWELSHTVTGTLAILDAVSAMPNPIWPPPMTPSFLICAACASAKERLVVLKERHCMHVQRGESARKLRLASIVKAKCSCIMYIVWKMSRCLFEMQNRMLTSQSLPRCSSA